MFVKHETAYEIRISDGSSDVCSSNLALMWDWGAIDFAGGTVVHIKAGIAGFVGSILVGKRVGLGKDMMAPHSMTLTMVGASMLWVGWFGFNAGSAAAANGTAGLAMLNRSAECRVGKEGVRTFKSRRYQLP